MLFTPDIAQKTERRLNSAVLYDALGWLDLFGIAVFAISGALVAARNGQTLITFAFFALVTGVGGGTVRDLLIGAPVFWVQDSRVPILCLAIALVVWITPVRIWRPAAVDWFDAIGLAAYSVFGAAKALQLGIDPVPAAIMGIITASVGGVIRDLIAGEPSIIIRPELYVTAGALSGLCLRRAGADRDARNCRRPHRLCRRLRIAGVSYC